MRSCSSYSKIQRYSAYYTLFSCIIHFKLVVVLILFAAQYMSSFKSFMLEVRGEKILYAFNNLQDIYEYLSVLNVSPDIGDEMR